MGDLGLCVTEAVAHAGRVDRISSLFVNRSPTATSEGCDSLAIVDSRSHCNEQLRLECIHRTVESSLQVIEIAKFFPSPLEVLCVYAAVWALERWVFARIAGTSMVSPNFTNKSALMVVGSWLARGKDGEGRASWEIQMPRSANKQQQQQQRDESAAKGANRSVSAERGRSVVTPVGGRRRGAASANLLALCKLYAPHLRPNCSLPRLAASTCSPHHSRANCNFGSRATVRPIANSAPSLQLGPLPPRGHGGLVVRPLASHQRDPGSIPGWVTPDFRMWESCRTWPVVGGFSRGSPVSPALSFWRCSILTSITLIGCQDHDVKSRPNLFTHSLCPLNFYPKSLRLDYSPPAKVNRVKSPTGGYRAARCRWSAGFLGNLPFPMSVRSGTAPFSPDFTLIDFQALDVESRANLSTQFTIQANLPTLIRQSTPGNLLANRMGQRIMNRSQHAIANQAQGIFPEARVGNQRARRVLSK
ncbi:hypothetical protein PR048_004502 [Dryococelus australis]|uniref:Uncharacterized protein n=1 Tax=Dryococelus australis TaxID=614101 RepID=A0ABQ9I5M9_9NEOP|nr:hypothetical protein PR048_004502 [Dryococelus australis]